MDGILESPVNAEPAANVEPQNNEPATMEPVQTNNVEPVEPQQGNEPQQNPVQTAEENAKYAEVRRRAEAEAKAKARDELISEMYGESNGIHTYAEYQEAIAKQEQEQKLHELLEQNVPEEYAKEMIENRKFREQFETESKAKQQQEKQQAEMQDFIKKYPNVKPDDIPVEVWQVNASGVPLRYAYADYANDQATKAEEIARANAENAKSSTGSVSGDGAANSSDFISYDTYEQNKSNPSWVNKNFNKIMNSRAMW